MAVSCLLCYAVLTYTVIMFARILLSWLTMFWSPPHSLSPAIRVIYDLTEPVLKLFRRYIPSIGMLDISPIIIFILLSVIRRVVCQGCG
jgi:YggT family protein